MKKKLVADRHNIVAALQDYRFFKISADTKWKALVTDVCTTENPVVLVGKNLERATSLYKYINEMVASYAQGQVSKLLSPADAKLVKLIGEAWADPEKCLQIADIIGDVFWTISDEAETFLSKEELLLLSKEADPTEQIDFLKYQHACKVHNYLVLLLLNLKMNREFLRQATETIFKEINIWNTAEMKSTFIPTQLILISELFHDGIDNTFIPETEISQVVNLLSSSGIPFRRTTIDEIKFGWAKDIKLWLPSIDGQPNYCLVRKQVENSSLELITDVFSPEVRESIIKGSVDISQGGAVVSGFGKTPFMIFSSDVDIKKMHNLEQFVKTMPGYAETEFYVLPAGFATLMYKGKTHRIANNHLDNVMGFIPAKANEYNRNILLVDPLYFQEIKDSPSFLDMLKCQELLVIEVDRDEVQYNPANFGEPKPGYYVFNYCPRTIARLRLHSEVYKMIETESQAVRSLPIMGGSVGCLIGREPV